MTVLSNYWIDISAPYLTHNYLQTSTLTMSWQSYVDDQLLATKQVTKAAIAGHDGTIWATSEGFSVSQEEVKAILANFADQEKLAQNGITIAGSR